MKTTRLGYRNQVIQYHNDMCYVDKIKNLAEKNLCFSRNIYLSFNQNNLSIRIMF